MSNNLSNQSANNASPLERGFVVRRCSFDITEQQLDEFDGIVEFFFVGTIWFHCVFNGLIEPNTSTGSHRQERYFRYLNLGILLDFMFEMSARKICMVINFLSQSQLFILLL